MSEAASAAAGAPAPRSPHSQRSGRWGRWVFAGVVCAVAVGVVQQSLVVLRAEWHSSLASERTELWMSGQADMDDEAKWQRAVQDLQAALALTPQDAVLHDSMAQLYSLRANQVWTTGQPGTPEMALYAQALEAQLASLRLRPTHAASWANLALIHYGLNSTPEETFAAWHKALKLGPYEPEVQELLLFVATEAWEAAPEEVRQWAERQRPGLGQKIAAKAAEEAASAAAAAASSVAAAAPSGASGSSGASAR